MASTSRTTMASSTQAALAPATAPAVTAAAPQLAGNEAAQTRAGTLGATPAPADTLGGALDALGDMAAVVLDALPLAEAAPLAIAHRARPWASRWLAAQAGPALFAAAGELASSAFDTLWPVGFGITVDGMAGVDIGVDAELSGAVGVERTADGFSVRVSGTATGALAAGLGAKTTGAEGAIEDGAQAEVKLGATYGVEAVWDIDPDTLLRALVDAGPTNINDLLLGRVRSNFVVERVLVPLIAALPPSELRCSAEGALTGTAEADMPSALGGAGFEAIGEGGHGAALGMDADGAYLEMGARIGQEVALHALFTRLHVFGLPSELGAVDANDLSVRLRGAADAVRALDLARLSFEVTRGDRVNDVRRVDTVALDTVYALVDYLVTMVDPTKALFGAEGAPVAAEALPERTLTRSVEHTPTDVDALIDVHPAVEGPAAEVQGLIAAQVAGGEVHGDLEIDLDATVSGQVAVPTEAVRAALGGAPLTPGPEGIEARVLDVERAIAADTVGGSMYEGVPADLDYAAAAEEVETRQVEILFERAIRAGAGIEGDVGLGLGGKGFGNLTFSMRHRVDGLGASERRALLGDDAVRARG
jgi:hypothetical protein